LMTPFAKQASTVTPARLPTAVRTPVILVKRLDFPVLGFPTRAMVVFTAAKLLYFLFLTIPF
jgi:hypothetical protein